MVQRGEGFTVQDPQGLNLEGEPADKTGRTATPNACGPPRSGSLPPVDFEGFLLGLGQTALVHLGEMPEPQSGARCPDLEQARHTIDLLDLLEAKTRGNLSEEESTLLQYLLSDLKLRYVRLTR
ncbi:MAG: DUF1844 domain-containing protein [Deltaproteobacteria bacterium]|nr:DUF1844 domain-containing protein [Deltaproteobacteria bacterium]